MHENVIVLGASDNPERYSNKAIKMLTEKGHKVFPIHPKLKEINGIKVYSNLSEIEDVTINTITLYVNPEISSTLADAIISIKPQRVIFNPGTENPALEEILHKAKIQTIEACTLVMLSISQF
jgi:predicted CoA-binding protein